MRQVVLPHFSKCFKLLYRSFLVENFEELLHDNFGDKAYWDVSVCVCVCVCACACVRVLFGHMCMGTYTRACMLVPVIPLLGGIHREWFL